MKRLVVVTALAALIGVGAQAQTYPAKPITIVIPFPPGPGLDLVARMVGDKLSAQIGQPVVYENRTGASGSIAAEYVVRAVPDGPAGFAGKAELEHVGYGTMNGPDGKPFKTRAGGAMKLHDLKPAPGSKRAKRRVGRGIGGKGGKTAGRGHKGQGARGTVSPRFEGGQTPLHRRTPKSKGFTNPFRVEYHVVNLEVLDGFDSGAEVSPETLRERGLVSCALPEPSPPHS